MIQNENILNEIMCYLRKKVYKKGKFGVLNTTTQFTTYFE